jgi:hypothetical protein
MVLPASVQRLTQSTTSPPTFGEFFGQALVRSIGAPARQSRQDRADFLKVAPSLIQQGVLTTTTSDDPEAIKFGNKTFSSGGVALKPAIKQPSSTDILNQAKTAKIFAELGGQGQLSQASLEKFFIDPTVGPAALIRANFADELVKAQKSGDPNAVAEVEAKINQEMLASFNSLMSTFRGSPNAITAVNGVPTFMVQDASGKVRPATTKELTNPAALKPATQDQLDEQSGDAFEQLLKEAASSGSQASKDLLGNLKKTPGKKITAENLDKSLAQLFSGTTKKLTRGITERPGLAGAAAFFGGKAAAPFISAALPGGFPGQAALAPKAPLGKLAQFGQQAGLRLGPAIGGAAKLAGPIAIGATVGRDLGQIAGQFQEKVAPGLTGLFADPFRFATDPAFRQFSLQSQPSQNIQQPGFLESINPLNVTPLVPSSLQTGAAQELGETDFSQLLQLLNSGR